MNIFKKILYALVTTIIALAILLAVAYGLVRMLEWSLWSILLFPAIFLFMQAYSSIDYY